MNIDEVSELVTAGGRVEEDAGIEIASPNSFRSVPVRLVKLMCLDEWQNVGGHLDHGNRPHSEEDE